MKKVLLFFILLLSFNWGFAQTEKAKDKRVAASFESKFNGGDFNGVFDLFSSDMKEFLPENETNDFLTDLKNKSGKIKEREFRKYIRGTFASYKTTFEKGVFSLNISTDNNSMINGLSIEPYIEENLPELERNKTKLILPFDGEWTVVWGGDIAEQNYHVESRAQKNAFDFVIKDQNGKSFRTDGKTNEDYYAFNKQLIAPCDGEIVLKVDGIDDNVPGEFNPIYIPGNTVILKSNNQEFLFLAHFKQNSIKVKQGQRVRKGEILGLCGNSGNSSEPHLHFHIQNVKDMNVATGVKSYFDHILVDGEIKKDYSPIKGERIENAE